MTTSSTPAYCPLCLNLLEHCRCVDIGYIGHGEDSWCPVHPLGIVERARMDDAPDVRCPACLHPPEHCGCVQG